MSDWFRLAIEGISIFTAVGVVISVFLYTYVFGRHGVGYLGIASFSDMLRDSMTVLIIGAVSACGFFVINFFGEVPRLAGLLQNEGRGSRLIKSISLALGAATALVVVLHVFRVMANARLSTDGTDWPMAFVITVAIMTAMFYWMVSRKGEVNPAWEENSRFNLTLSNAFYWTCAVVLAGGFNLDNRLSNGIVADIYPVDRDLCRGKYTVMWIGDARMVARCTDTKRVVVKIIK